MTEDMREFQERYPGMYQKFLEMNRALFAMQRNVDKLAHGAKNTPPGDDSFKQGDLPTELEWD